MTPHFECQVSGAPPMILARAVQPSCCTFATSNVRYITYASGNATKGANVSCGSIVVSFKNGEGAGACRRDWFCMPKKPNGTPGKKAHRMQAWLAELGGSCSVRMC
jgi:hypothetical protein